MKDRQTIKLQILNKTGFPVNEQSRKFAFQTFIIFGINRFAKHIRGSDLVCHSKNHKKKCSICQNKMHSLILTAIVLCSFHTITTQLYEDASADDLVGILIKAVSLVNEKYSEDLEYVAIVDESEKFSDVKIYNLTVLLSTWTGSVVEYNCVIQKHSAKGPVDVTFTRGNSVYSVTEYL